LTLKAILDILKNCYFKKEKGEGKVAKTATEELTPEVIQGYKVRLKAQKKELQKWLKTRPDKINLTGYEEVAERAEAIEKHEQEKMIVAGKLQDIEDALVRIEDGSFGTCPVCKGKIPKQRLDVDPTYKRCCSCQANHFAEQLKIKPKRNNNYQPRTLRKKKQKPEKLFRYST